MVDGNKIIIIFYLIYCACANYKCCIMPSRARGPDLENKVSCILVGIIDIDGIMLENGKIDVQFNITSLLVSQVIIALSNPLPTDPSPLLRLLVFQSLLNLLRLSQKAVLVFFIKDFRQIYSSLQSFTLFVQI